MVYYRQGSQIFLNGPAVAVEYNGLLHPPLLFLLQGGIFHYFGVSPQSYSLLGYLFFISTSIGFYFFISRLFSRKIALAMSLLLFMNPLIIVNTLYPNPDIILLPLFALTLYAHITNKRILLLVSYVLLFLTKETGLVLFASLTTLRILQTMRSSATRKSKIKQLIGEFAISIPVCIVFIAWTKLTNALGVDWKNTWLHEETTETSYILFAVKKMLSLNVINTYLIQNIFNIFALNFQWMYTLMVCVLSFRFHRRQNANPKQKQFITSLLVMSGMYLFTVLSFPTWTIPRYGIPLLLPLYFFLSFYMDKIKRTAYYYAFLGGFLIITLVSNTTSVDPISLLIGNTRTYDETIYSNDNNTNGPDGNVYNFQIIRAVARQNEVLVQAINHDADIILTNCEEYKFSERLWSISLNPEIYQQFNFIKPIECKSRQELLTLLWNGELSGKKIWNRVDRDTWVLEAF